MIHSFNQIRLGEKHTRFCFLLDIVLEVLTLHQLRDILILLLLTLTTGLVLLQVLVALGQLAQGGQTVGAELVEDAGDELGEFLFFAVAVEGEGVGGDGGVDLHFMLVYDHR